MSPPRKASCVFLIFLIVISICEFVESRPDNVIRHTEQIPKSVKHRGLLNTVSQFSVILKENFRVFSDTWKKNFTATTLAYVTPWNNRGYDHAKNFNSKLDYVSPTWFLFRLGKTDKLSFELIGQQDVDLKWMEEVRTPHEDAPDHITRIVPRFMFENWQREHFLELFSDVEKQTAMINLIMKTCKQYSFDGVVIDTSYLGIIRGNQGQKIFYQNLAEKLHVKERKLILVQPANRDEYTFMTSEDFLSLSSFVDFFSLMTYDFSQEVGPIAPIPFMTKAILSLVPPESRSNLEITSKILMGLPFYGYDYELDQNQRTVNKKAVIGNTYLGLLLDHRPKIDWVEAEHEHHFHYSQGTHVVYYPTIGFIYERIKLAQQLGVGISIWEIGQGLDYFFDMF